MHNPPPFTPPDIRISPSGPYVNPPIPPGGGGIILFGADAVVELQQLEGTAGATVPIDRDTVPNPLSVIFPEWTSGDTLWIVWHLSGTWLPGGAETPVGTLRVFPTVDVGAGPEFIDNAMSFSSPVLTPDTPESLAIGGTAAIRITNPTQPPIVQLYYALDTAEESGALVRVPGTSLDEDAGSCWLTCAELSQAIVFQLPTEVTLQPL
jgi:hypothetical protein